MSNIAAEQASSHSHLMDRVYRHQRHIYDATRKYYLLGRDQLIHDLDMKPGQSLLEVACGTGRNLVLASRRYPGIKIAGLDISEEMLITARRALTREGNFHAAIRRADAARYSAAEFSMRGFDRIVISYALSMIPEWQKTIEQSLAALNPGGSLHIADFGQQARLPAGFRTLLQSWLIRFHVTPRADLRQALEEAIGDRPYRLEFRSHARDYAWIATIRRDGTKLPVSNPDRPELSA